MLIKLVQSQVQVKKIIEMYSTIYETQWIASEYLRKCLDGYLNLTEIS